MPLPRARYPFVKLDAIDNFVEPSVATFAPCLRVIAKFAGLFNDVAWSVVSVYYLHLRRVPLIVIWPRVRVAFR